MSTVMHSRTQSWVSLSHRYRAAVHRVSSSRVYRAAVHRVSTSYRTAAARVSSSRVYQAAADRLSTSYQATAGTARKHSRVSVVAASVAVAGVLGAAGFAVGAAPSGQAAGKAAATVHGHASSASGQPGAKPQDGKPLAGGQLDTIRSAEAAAQHEAAVAAAKHQAAAAAAQRAQAVAKQQAAKQRWAARVRAAKAKAAKQWAARVNAAKAKAHAAPASPYLVYDSVRPEGLPHDKVAAVYANGNYAASSSQMKGRGSVLWIDTNGSDPAADALDVEPGDATPYGAAQWVQHRLSAQPHSVAIVYTMRSEWQQVKDNVGHLPGWMQSKVRYWIADPTGVPHVVPGSNATQWYWGNSYDITTANPDLAR